MPLMVHFEKLPFKAFHQYGIADKTHMISVWMSFNGWMDDRLLSEQLKYFFKSDSCNDYGISYLNKIKDHVLKLT